MAFKKIQDWLATAEIFIEDLILVLLSIFLIILAISALVVLGGGAPVSEERVTAISALMQASFLAKAEYFAMLILPWMLMIIGLLLARELWLLRRRIEGIHFEVMLSRLRTAPKVKPARKPVRRR